MGDVAGAVLKPCAGDGEEFSLMLVNLRVRTRFPYFHEIECDAMLGLMTLEEYKTVLYRLEDGSWVAEVPAISGCYALMPTRDEALSELGRVFEMIAAEYQEKGRELPHDTTEIVNA
jgi:predicted RNase H-like HicB family nuclease